MPSVPRSRPSIPVPEDRARLHDAQVRFDQIQAAWHAERTALEERFSSLELQLKAVGRARAALDAFEVARRSLGAIKEGRIRIAQRKGENMSEQRSEWRKDSESAEQYFREECVKLDSQAETIKSLMHRRHGVTSR
jgi:hypothetical protein